MAINKKLIHFDMTKQLFMSNANGLNNLTKPTNGIVGNIPYYSVVFLKDGYIWTHGHFINGTGIADSVSGNATISWSKITDKPSTFTPSAHTQAYTTLTGSGTTANQAIVSSGTANGWTLKTLGSRAFDNTNYLPLAGGTLSGKLNIGSVITSHATKLEVRTANTTANSVEWGIAVKNPYNDATNYNLGVGIRIGLGEDTETGKFGGIAYIGTSTYFNSGKLAFYADGDERAYLTRNNLYIGNNAVCHAGNSSISKSGETLTVKINGTSQSLTNTNTWRGIHDNLTSTSTTESLSAKQGYLLANGSARDNTKLPLAGGTMVGTISASSDAYGGGGFHNGYANIILRGNATTGTSGIVFSSSKGDTSINRSSDCAFIQYHPYGVSTATAVGTNPTIGTSGEAGRFVIGIHNDSGDQLWLQTSAVNDLKHVVGANVYTIYDSGNLPAYPTKSSWNYDDRYSFSHQPYSAAFAFNIEHNSNYVTFDGAQLAGAPNTNWFNGFISTHNNYLSSYLINQHRTSDWYVGYSESKTAPTWYKLIHSGNYTDYTVTKTGSGASGTWDINITGNADTIDGYHAVDIGKAGWTDAGAQSPKKYYKIAKLKLKDTWSVTLEVDACGDLNYCNYSSGKLFLSCYNGTSLSVTLLSNPSYIETIYAYIDSEFNVWLAHDQLYTGMLRWRCIQNSANDTARIELYTSSIISQTTEPSSYKISANGSYHYYNSAFYFNGGMYNNSNNASYPIIKNCNLEGNASTATKATQDSDGSQINTTYLKKSGGTMSGGINMGGNSITNLGISGGIYWNPYVESSSDGSDAASIRVVTGGVAGGTTLVISQMNDANDTIQFSTNASASLYHNSNVILTSGNSSISESGSTATIKINGTSKTVSLSSHTHSYLPLTGGSLSGYLTVSGGSSHAPLIVKGGLSGYRHNIQLIPANDWSGILFGANDVTGEVSNTTTNSYWVGNNNGKFSIAKNGSGNASVSLYCDGTDWYANTKKIIHAGNIGSQSVNYAASAGNADKVDNVHLNSILTAANSIGNRTQNDHNFNSALNLGVYEVVWGGYIANHPSDWEDGSNHFGSLLHFGNTGNHGYIMIDCSTRNLYFKGINSYLGYGEWYNVAHSGNSSVSKSGETLTVKINNISQSLTNTTYSAGNGLALNGTQFSIASNVLVQGSVIDTHHEGHDTITLDGTNELYAFYDRGGTCDAYEVEQNATLTNQTLTRTSTSVGRIDANVFNGIVGYNQSSVYRGEKFAVYDLVLPTGYWHSTHFFWSFGNSVWKPAKMRILIGKYSASGFTYVSRYSSDACPEYGKVDVGNGGTGFNRLRIVVSKYSRLACFGITNYATNGLSTTYMSRCIDDVIYRNISPAKDNTWSLGTSSLRWKEVRAVNFYGAFNGTATNASKDSDGNAINSTYLKRSGGTMTGLITTTSGNNHNGIKIGNTYINAINGELILQNNGTIRFGGDSWDYNVWAGLKYVHSSKSIYLGLADGTYFTANSAQSGGTIYTPGISSIYVGTGNLVLTSANSSISESGSTATIKINGTSKTVSLSSHNHDRRYLRNYHRSDDITSTEVVNTDDYIHNVGDTGGSSTTMTKPSGMDNAWGIFHMHLHTGNYSMQLGFGGTTGHMYFRNAYNSSTFSSWKTLIDSDNIGSQSVASATKATQDSDGNQINTTYLKKSGGTMTGRISRESGGAWISARDNVIVYTTRTSEEGSDWHPVVGGKTSSGFWSLGSVGGETLILSYDTDSDYNAGRNNNTRLNIPLTNGTLATESYVTSRGYITSSVSEIVNISVDGYALKWGTGLKYALGSNGSSDFYIWGENGAALRLGTNNTEHIRITSGGNVGIGTTTPSYKFDVNGTLHANGATTLSSTLYVGNNATIAGTLGVYGTTTLKSATTINANTYISGETYFSAVDAFRLNYGSYGVIHRNDGGSYWILLTNKDNQNGGFNSLRPFHIDLSTGTVYMDNNAIIDNLAFTQCNISMGGRVNATWGYDLNTNDYYGLYFKSKNSSSTGILFNDDGNVGINTTSPLYKLDVNGTLRVSDTITATSLAADYKDTWNDGTHAHPWYGYDHRYANTGVYSTTISDYFGMTLKTMSGNISITNGGNVGIGTFAPLRKLHVIGEAIFGESGYVASQGTGSGYSGTWVGQGFMELSAPNPYIDFHANKSTADFTSRLIQWSDKVRLLYVSSDGAYNGYILTCEGNHHNPVILGIFDLKRSGPGSTIWTLDNICGPCVFTLANNWGSDVTGNSHTYWTIPSNLLRVEINGILGDNYATKTTVKAAACIGTVMTRWMNNQPVVSNRSHEDIAGCSVECLCTDKAPGTNLYYDSNSPGKYIYITGAKPYGYDEGTNGLSMDQFRSTGHLSYQRVRFVVYGWLE